MEITFYSHCVQSIHRLYVFYSLNSRDYQETASDKIYKFGKIFTCIRASECYGDRECLEYAEKFLLLCNNLECILRNYLGCKRRTTKFFFFAMFYESFEKVWSHV